MQKWLINSHNSSEANVSPPKINLFIISWNSWQTLDLPTDQKIYLWFNMFFYKSFNISSYPASKFLNEILLLLVAIYAIDFQPWQTFAWVLEVFMSCLAKECSQSHLADLNMSKTLQNLIFSRTSVRVSRSRATRRCMTASTLSQFEKTPRENIQASNMRLWPELYRVSSLSRSQPQAGKYR